MSKRPVAVDTSVAIPLLMTKHEAHRLVVGWWRSRPLVLSDHAAVETYSVLTRLPGDARLTPANAAKLIAARFGSPVLLTPAARSALPRTLADLEIAGGAVYDALVALAAKEAKVVLATRDARAQATYERIGVDLELVI